MKGKTVFGVTLLAFVGLQIGFFVVSDETFALPRRMVMDGGGGGGGGGGELPPTRTTTATNTTSDACGESSTVTTTTIDRLIGGVYRLVQVTVDGTFSRSLYNDTHRWHEVIDYERDLSGALRGVISFTEGSVTLDASPTEGEFYTEGKSFNLYPGEVAKIAKLTRHSKLINLTYPAGWSMTQESTLQYQYDATGTPLGLEGASAWYSTDANGVRLYRESSVQRYTLIAGAPRLIHSEVHGHTEDGALPEESDAKISYDYQYDGSGRLIGLTTPGVDSLSTNRGGPFGLGMGSITDTQLTFIMDGTLAVISNVYSEMTTWERDGGPGQTCIYRYELNYQYAMDGCGRLTGATSVPHPSDCTIGGTTLVSSPSETVTVCEEGAECVTVDKSTASALELLKKAVPRGFMEPKVEVR